MGEADNQLHSYMVQTTDFKRRLGLRIPPGFHYYGPEDYVLDHGGPFESGVLTSDELALVMDAIQGSHIRFQRGHCFYNAQKLVLADTTKTLKYVEGMAIGVGAFPTLHGWATINGKVIDLTWQQHTSKRKGRFRDRVLGEIPDGWAYHGVTFESDWVLARWAHYGASFSFLDDYYHGYPLFQEPRLRRWEDIHGHP